MSDPAIPATVQIGVLTSSMPPAFREAALLAKGDNDEGSFEYNGMQFVVDSRTYVYAALTDIEQPLPEIFQSELTADLIVVQVAELPGLPLPKPGRYHGKRYGYPEAIVAIWPDAAPTNSRPPAVSVYGWSFDEVIALFKLVLAGGLEPGESKHQ